MFPHKDVDAARKILKDLPAAQRKLLITDGVFSMDGDLGPLPELCALAEEFGAIMMVDDAHASGVFGREGRGTVDHFDCHGRVDIQVGTLSKAIGVLGGYVAGTQASSSSCTTARGRSCSPPRIRRRSRPPASPRSTCSKRSRSGWSSSGTTPGSSRLACTPRLQHRPERQPDYAGHRRRGATAAQMSDRLFERGRVRAGIGFPTVARDKARLRTIVTATHSREDLQFALDMFGKVGQGTRGDLT